MQTDEDYLNSVAELLKEARLGCTRLAINPDEEHAILCSIDEKLRVALLLLCKMRGLPPSTIATPSPRNEESVRRGGSKGFSGRITGGY